MAGGRRKQLEPLKWFILDL